jgi:hypothetical protein
MSNKKSEPPHEHQSQTMTGAGNVVSQRVHNNGSNIGAQGVFYGPVTFYSANGNVTSIASKEEFLRTLDALKQNLQQAVHAGGVAHDVVAATTIELEVIAREVQHDVPDPEHIKQCFQDLYDMVQAAALDTTLPHFREELGNIAAAADELFCA